MENIHSIKYWRITKPLKIIYKLFLAKCMKEYQVGRDHIKHSQRIHMWLERRHEGHEKNEKRLYS